LLTGGHQERDQRAGTENVAGTIGFGVAANLAAQSLPVDPPRIAALRDRLEQGLLARIPGAIVNGAGQPRLPNTTNMAFPGAPAEPLLILLSEAGIAASAGAACSSGSLEPSHVLTAMGVPEGLGHTALRFSLSRHTTSADVDRVLEVLPGFVARLRALHPGLTRPA
jgi:cysteine desulfurase